jgi:small subunit ribosomal protein S4
MDNVIYRMGLAPSRNAARQLVRHNHFTVNGKRVNIPSYALSKGDEIAPAQKKIEKFPIKTALQNMKDSTQPHWLAFDVESKKGIVQDLPTREDITIPIQEQLVVELYSR